MRRRLNLSGWIGSGALLAAAAPAWAQETVEKRHWWLPTNVFPATESIDHLFYFCLYLTSAVCVGVFLVLAIFLVQYRHQPGRQAKFTHGNNKLEIAWTLIPTLILALIAAFSNDSWSKVKNWPEVDPANPPIQVRVIAQQFQWNFHYPGADGKFGTRRTELVDKSGNPDKQIGLDRNDPNGKDDLVTNSLVVPVNRKVYVALTSRDVIHSFYLPYFRTKQDALPGLDGRLWFESVKTSGEVVGTGGIEAFMGKPDGAKPFDIVCAELCGPSHYTMRGQLFVVSEAEYQEYLKQQQGFLPAAGAGGSEGY